MGQYLYRRAGGYGGSAGGSAFVYCDPLRNFVTIIVKKKTQMVRVCARKTLISQQMILSNVLMGDQINNAILSSAVLDHVCC